MDARRPALGEDSPQECVCGGRPSEASRGPCSLPHALPTPELRRGLEQQEQETPASLRTVHRAGSRLHGDVQKGRAEIPGRVLVARGRDGAPPAGHDFQLGRQKSAAGQRGAQLHTHKKPLHLARLLCDIYLERHTLQKAKDLCNLKRNQRMHIKCQTLKRTLNRPDT